MVKSVQEGHYSRIPSSRRRLAEPEILRCPWVEQRPRICQVFFDFSAENAKIADCLAERDGFELSVPVSKLADDSF